MKITVIGSINMDIVMKVPRLPQKGETLLASEYLRVPGGKGANQAVAVARLGVTVSMVGALGKDAEGDCLLKQLKQEGIDTAGVLRTDTASGNALITVDEKGDNTILVYPGANLQVTPAWVMQQKELIVQADWIMLQLEIPMESVVTAAHLARNNGTQVLLNPAPATQLSDELISLLDVLTPNETEIVLLSGESDIATGASRMLDKGIDAVVVTLGSKGSMAIREKQTYHAPPCHINAVDTTAAGDAYNAALLTALAEGKSFREALIFANAAGALTATRIGAQSSLPTRSAVDDFLKSNQC